MRNFIRCGFARIPTLLMLAVLACFCAGSLAAQETSSLPESEARGMIQLSQMFTFFFLMLGPLKILGPFVQMTKKDDPAFTRKLAVRAFIFSCVALVAAAVIGERSLRRYHISVPVLAIAAGIILFLIALQTILHQFDPGQSARHEYEPSLRLALSPLAFPTIVTPYGVPAVIICMTLTPDYTTKGVVFGALLGLMLLNLVAMLYARPILKYLGMPMMLLGTVLGIIQVALGLQIILTGLRSLGFGAK